MFQKKDRQKVLDPDVDFSKIKSVHSISSWFGIFGIVFVLILGNISNYLFTNLPVPLKNAHLTNFPERFIAERAWKDLKIITEFGPKPTGTYANEVLAVDFLNREISYIDQLKNKNQKIVVDNQVVSGAMSGGWRNRSVSSIYRNVQNIVVKLVGQSEHALMLNCHFDSVPGSPGASDDAASCCVMLEILRVLSRQSKINRHSIIFLFNGAEETPLQASHGFITQHPWAKDIRAFINLESAGSGGKELLFQTGPKHPWLIDLYTKAVMHPFAQAAGEEIFQSGLIPSDTDFRIFRDFGKIPGMDFAHMVNGYRYHTKYDSIEYIPPSVLQRTGDNILELTKVMANCEEIENPEKYSAGEMVFFDFLGLFFISYTADVGFMINFCVVILSLIIPFLSLVRATRGIHGHVIRSETIIGFESTLFSAALGGVVCFLIGYQLDLMGRSMSWYSSTYLILGIYCCPALLVHCLVHMYFDRQPESKKSPLSLALKVQARLNGTNLLLGIITLGITFAGYRSAYVFMVIVLTSLLSNMLISMFNIQNSVNKWLYIHIFFQIFAILWACQFYITLIKVFVPITGRIGASKNPEIVISIIAAFCTTLTTCNMMPLIHLLKTKDKLIAELAAITLIALSLASSTHMGFPYRDASEKAPAVQRHYITHTSRVFHDYNGGIRFRDSGFLLREMDRNAKKTIEGIAMPNDVIPQYEMESCKNEVFCGLPIYSYFHQFIFAGYWLPGPAPIVRRAVTMKLNEKVIINEHESRMHLTLKECIQSSLIIRPKSKVELLNWDILDHIPGKVDLGQDRAYFVLITCGLERDNHMNITLDFNHELINYDGPLVDITVTTTHWEYHKEHTPVFQNLLNRVPNWAHVVPSVAEVNAYTF